MTTPSSTFRDLQPYRRSAEVALRRVGCLVLQMEYYGAESRTPLARVREDIRNCDAFVGIYAWRRGSSPPASGNKGIKLPPGLTLGQSSYTEFELAFAREMGIPDFLFVLDDSVPWPPYQIEGLAEGESIAPVTAFRQKFRDGALVTTFVNPDDLASRVATSLANVEPTRRFRDALRPPVMMGDMERIFAKDELEDTSLATIKAGLVSMATESARGIPAPALHVDLSHDWWSTRLLLYTALARKYVGVSCLLITESLEDPDPKEHFVGLISVETAMERLLELHKDLEGKIDEIEARNDMFPDAPTELEEEIDQDVTTFKAAFSAAKMKPENQRKLDVTAYQLQRWMGDAMLTRPVSIKDIESPTRIDLALVSRFPHRFVPIHAESGLAPKGRNPNTGGKCWVIDQSDLATTLSEFFLSDQFGS